MIVLIVSSDDEFIKKINSLMSLNKFHTIVYKWIIKAIDNIEEICPDVCIINAEEYPRHWKTLVQYCYSGISKIKPKIILYSPKDLSKEEKEKQEELNIFYNFSTLEEKELNNIINLLDSSNDETIENKKNTEKVVKKGSSLLLKIQDMYEK